MISLKMQCCLLALMLMIGFANAQNFNQDPGNPNLDFSSGNFNGWNISWGPRTHPDSIPGAQAGANSHTIVGIYGNNYDGNAGNGNLLRVPVGLEQVARLGAPAGGGYTNPTAYSMNYAVTVHAAYPILHFQLASIMDRSHSLAENTHYRFKILDVNGNVLIAAPCGALELYPNGPGNNNVTANPAIALSTLPVTGAIMYQPWQSVAIDLSAFSGQTIRIQFDHFDCISGFHGSYDYIAAAMRKKLDTVYYCPGSAAVIKPYLPNFKSYIWNDGSNSDSLLINNPSDGNIYTCTAFSFNGCSATFSYKLKAITTQVDFSSTVGTQCNQMQFLGTATTDTGNILTYQWDFGDMASGSANTAFTQNASHVFTSNGIYTVTLKVTTSAGCQKSITKVVTVAADGAQAAMQISNPVCSGDTINVKDITVNGVSRLWYLNQNQLPDTSIELSFVFEETGIQQIAIVAIGANGCPDSNATSITVFPKPDVAIRVVPESAPVTDPQFQFYGSPESANTYIWDFGNGTVSSDAKPFVVYDPVIHSYKVTLKVTDINGCSDTSSISVHVMPPGILIPSAFSPNGDDLNDVFKIVNITNQQLLECSIFNRFGQRVFYSMTASTGWDGSFHNKPCDMGTYFYVIRLQPKGGESLVYKGSLLLIR